MKYFKKVIYALFLVTGVLGVSVKADTYYIYKTIEAANEYNDGTNLNNLVLIPLKEVYHFSPFNIEDFALSGYLIYDNMKIDSNKLTLTRADEETYLLPPKDGKIIISSTIDFEYKDEKIKKVFYAYVDETLPEDKTIIDTLNGKTFTYEQYKKKSNTGHFTLSNGDKVAGNIKYWKKENGEKVEYYPLKFQENDYGTHKVSYSFIPKNDNFQEVSGIFYIKIPYDKSLLSLSPFFLITGDCYADIKVKIDNKWYKCNDYGNFSFKEEKFKMGSTHKIKIRKKINGKYQTIYSGKVKVTDPFD